MGSEFSMKNYRITIINFEILAGRSQLRRTVRAGCSESFRKLPTLEHSSYCISCDKDGGKIYRAGTLNDVAIFDAEKMKQAGRITFALGIW
ncbi:hypothetical protein A8L59_17550 [Pseudomonas koreensis]|uniref:Uncharacterized protein n=1 Tax=Pseudomonas koreensis TaxID=198620 RepID=A0AAC9BUT5_9PSED|nr:hypothetical protein A8L59_17550 [Pseudomonas koreensis]